MSSIPTHKHGMKPHPVTRKHRGMTEKEKAEHKKHAQAVVARTIADMLR